MKAKVSLLPFVAVGALIAAVSFADDMRAIREKVKDAVNARDVPRSAQWWTQLGPEGAVALREVFAESGRLHAKIRVLEAYRYFSDADSALFLRKAVLEQENAALRRIAILSLARSQGIREKATFETLLASADPFTRVAAALGLRLMPEPEAAQMLKDFLAQETVSWIVARLQAPSNSLQSNPGLFRRNPPQGTDPRR
jgi:hypothetical protein